MQFTSFDFLVFFPAVVLLFYGMPRRLRQLWLLLASYYFYMGWNAKYALLILTSTYLCALLMEHAGMREGGRRKCRMILAAGIVSNLAILVFFKYFYFLHDTFAALVSVFGVEIRASRLDILLPVGISFYTFQALGYTIDVYRGTVKAEKNLRCSCRSSRSWWRDRSSAAGTCWGSWRGSPTGNSSRDRGALRRRRGDCF